MGIQRMWMEKQLAVKYQKNKISFQDIILSMLCQHQAPSLTYAYSPSR